MILYVTTAYPSKLIRSTISVSTWTQQERTTTSVCSTECCKTTTKMHLMRVTATTVNLLACVSVLQLKVRLYLNYGFSTSRVLPHPSNSYTARLPERCMFLQCAFTELSVLHAGNSSSPPTSVGFPVS